MAPTSVATVRVVNLDVEGGTMLINAVDFDPRRHELSEQPSEAAIAAVHARDHERELLAARSYRDRESKGFVARPSIDPTRQPKTMRIANPDVPGAVMIINEADFDERIHQLVEEQREAERAPEPPAPETPEPPATPETPVVDTTALVEELRASAVSATDAAAEADAAKKAADAVVQTAASGRRGRGQQS